MLEKILEDEPYNRQANLLLKQAALAAGWPEIGVFALQTLLEEKPRDTRLLHELGRLYHEARGERQRGRNLQPDQRHRPARCRGGAAGKRFIGPRFHEAGWLDAGGNYRDLFKEKATAVLLEQQSRMGLTGELLEQQIEESYARHQSGTSEH